MSMFNRRNALIGWATWTIVKQMARRKARQSAHVDSGTARRIAIPALMTGAAAAVLAVLLFWRRRSRPAGADEHAQ
jgi:hypothetical protein